VRLSEGGKINVCQQLQDTRGGGGELNNPKVDPVAGLASPAELPWRSQRQFQPAQRRTLRKAAHARSEDLASTPRRSGSLLWGRDHALMPACNAGTAHHPDHCSPYIHPEDTTVDHRPDSYTSKKKQVQDKVRPGSVCASVSRPV